MVRRRGVHHVPDVRARLVFADPCQLLAPERSAIDSPRHLIDHCPSPRRFARYAQALFGPGMLRYVKPCACDLRPAATAPSAVGLRPGSLLQSATWVDWFRPLRRSR